MGTRVILPPQPEAKTPGISITFPQTSRRAVLGTLLAVAAVLLGGSLAVWAVRSRADTNDKPTTVVSLATLPQQAATRLTAAEREGRIRRDIFFSNFAEADLPAFRSAELPADEQARFAVRHARINTPERIQTDPKSGERFVTGECVAQITQKYFGDAPVGISSAQRFYLPLNDLSATNVPFARVESWQSLPGGKGDRFAATVRVYEPPTGWKEDPYGWTMDTRSESGEPRLVGRWQATVRRVPGGYNPPFRYVLLSWKRL